MNYLRILSIGIILGWWALASSFCCGQEATSPPPAKEASEAAEPLVEKAPPEPEAIPPADITSQAAEVTVWLEKLDASLQSNPALTSIALDYSQQAQSMAKLRAELDRLRGATATTRQIEDQRREWNQQRSQVEGWMTAADERWKSLQESRKELLQRLTRWELTRDAKLENELPVEVQRRIVQIIEQLNSVQTTLQSRIDQLAEFIERLTNARMTIGEASARIDTFTESANQRLLTRDASYLWESQEADWLALDDTTRQTATRWLDSFRGFAIDNWFRMTLQFLLFMVLATCTVTARQSSKSWPEDRHELDRSHFLVSRPYSVALIFAILAGYFIYGPLPSVAHDFFYLLLLAPALRLAGGITSPEDRAGLFGILILAGLFPLVQFSPEGSLLTRVLLLFAEIAAIGIVCRANARWSYSDARERTRWRKICIAVGVVVLLLFVVALVANLLGWVSLAHFITESTLLTAQGAILAYIIGLVGAGLLPAVLEQGPGQALLSVRRHSQTFERIGVALLALVLIFIWSQQTLRRFRLEEPLVTRVESFLASPLSWAEVEITVGDVVRAVIILIATFFVQRILSFFLSEELFPRFRMRTSSLVVIATLLKYAIVTVGLVMAGSAIGLSSTQLTVLVGALGVGIGFGLQSIVNNFVSGLILMFEQPIKIGDIVEVGPNWGTVKKVGVRATVIQNFEGSELIVPNGDLISKEVKNWTLSDSATRVEVLVGVAYGSDPTEVLETLLETARENELVFTEPEPFAMMFGFGDSALNFRLLCWTSFENRGQVISQLHAGVAEALGRAGIKIPFPQRDLHLRSTDVYAPEFDRLSRAN